MNPACTMTVIGGDQRSAYLSELLHKRGCSVTVYGVPEVSSVIFSASSFREALNANAIIIGPVPTTKDSIHIFSPEGKGDLFIEDLKHTLTPEHLYIGGAIPASLTKHFNIGHIPYYDFMEDDTVALENAIATAEGTIMEAIRHSSRNLHKSRCLILGYGRCAAILAKKLAGLDTFITICARKPSARITAHCYGYDAIPLEDLENCISSYDFIFNTIPSLILPKELLSPLSPHVTIIDIASAPGGLDYGYVKEHFINAHLCLGLPGRISPESSAIILADNILNLLKERSE